MVYLQGILIPTTMTLLILTTFVVRSDVEAATTKFAYKKPIYGKTTNTIKQKTFKLKPELTQTTTTTTMPTTTTTVEINSASFAEATTISAAAKATTTTTATTQLNLVVAEDAAEAPKMLPANSSEMVAATEAAELQPPNNSLEAKTEVTTVDQQEQQSKDELDDNDESSEPEENAEEQQHQDEEEEEDQQVAAPPVLDVPVELESTTVASTPPADEANTTTTAATMMMTTTPERKVPVACTCGVFLTSQIKRGSSEPPQGKPVIINELARNYPCTAVGQKQCQTKCLETIVQHLPNSANILCATLNRDCRKERAYLFIKNCSDQWTNTNLAAGREYCCKDGQPYQCPMV